MGFFTRLLRLRQKDEQEGGGEGGGDRSTVHFQHHNHGEKLPSLYVLGISIYRAVKGLLRKLGSIFYQPKPAHPLLPLQNPATTHPLLLPTPTISSPIFASAAAADDDDRKEECYPAETAMLCSSSRSHSISEYTLESVTVPNEEEECENENSSYSPERNEIDSELHVSGVEIGCLNGVISTEEIVEEEDGKVEVKNIVTVNEEEECETEVISYSPERNEIDSEEVLVSGAEIGCSNAVITTEEIVEEEEDGKVEVKNIATVTTVNVKERKIKHYRSSHKILLVGEGDFSFSACLALAFGSATNIVATSLDSLAFLKENYGKAESNVLKIRSRGGSVMHGIDATQMSNHHLLARTKYDRIVFNFPFAGFFPELPAESELRRHRRLVSLFLKNAKEMISENGEIHISHKTNGNFHAQFNVESIASSHGLRLIEAVKLKRSDYPGYNTKYGFGGDNNFNCVPSKTFKFSL